MSIDPANSTREWDNAIPNAYHPHPGLTLPGVIGLPNGLSPDQERIARELPPLPAMPTSETMITGPLDLGFSHPCARLIGALALAKLDIQPPAKNKTATITPRDGGRSYSYSYADLSEVLKSVDIHLARNGLIQTSVLEGKRLHVIIYHTSGEWMRSMVELRPDKDGAKELASAVTYARRTVLQAMLGIAADDDDDGSAGAGDQISQAGPAPSREIAKWNANRAEWDALRRDDPTEWRRVVDATGARMDKTLGGAVTLTWKSIELAQTPAQRRAVREAMDSQWADALALYRRADPTGYSDLMRHYNDRAAIIDAQAAPPAKEPPTNREAALAAQTREGTFEAPLVGPDGVPGTISFSDPARWALAFELEYRATPADQRLAMWEHNQDTIAEVSRLSTGAEVILTDLAALAGEPPAPTPVDQPIEKPVEAEVELVVAVPKRRAGEPDRPAYLAALKRSLDVHVTDAASGAAWITYNEPVYRPLGMTMMAEVGKLLAGRKRALGLPPPNARE